MDSIVDTQYRWSKNGIMTTISTSTIDSTMTTKGDLWIVEVRVNDGTEWSLWTASSSLEILNTAPSLDSATISMNEAATDENVTVMATMSDVDGDQTTMSITWYLDGVIQLEYNNQATLPSTATNKGESWTAVVQANDGETASSQSETLSVLIINSDPLFLSLWKMQLLKTILFFKHPSLTSTMTSLKFQPLPGSEMGLEKVHWMVQQLSHLHILVRDKSGVSR